MRTCMPVPYALACEQALLGVGGGKGKEERACNDVSGIWMPPPILPAAPCCPSCQNLANQRKPETIANVKKHVKGTMLSDTLRKTGILADKNNSFSDRVCLPSATKIRKFSEGFYLIVSTLKADWPKGRGHKCRPKGQANLADCSANATNLLDIKNVENLTRSGQGKKKQFKEIGRISILQPGLRERGGNSQYRQCGFIGTLNSSEICIVVKE